MISSILLGLALSNKFLPVHCVVARDECPKRVLQDGFVIVPAQTKFYEIVSVVLKTMEADVGKIQHDERADGKKRRQYFKKIHFFYFCEERVKSTTWEDDFLVLHVELIDRKSSKRLNAFEVLFNHLSNI